MAAPPLPEKLALALFLFSLIPAAVIDIRWRRLPDFITLPGMILGIGASFAPGGMEPLQSFLGMVLGGGLLYGVGAAGGALLKREAMGGGDVKLMAAAGAFLAPLAALWAILAGSLLALLFVVARYPFTRKFRGLEIPFGPFLALGILFSVTFIK